MTRLGQRKLVGAMALLTLVLGYLVVIRPQAIALSEARQARHELQQQVDQAERQRARQAGADDAGPHDAAAALERAVPPTAGLPDLFRQLDALARETGVRHTSMSPSSAVTAAGGGSSVELAITLDGPAAGTEAYLARLGSLDRLVVVEQLEVQLPPGPAAGGVQARLTARVFTTAPPPQPPA